MTEILKLPSRKQLKAILEDETLKKDLNRLEYPEIKDLIINIFANYFGHKKMIKHKAKTLFTELNKKAKLEPKSIDGIRRAVFNKIFKNSDYHFDPIKKLAFS